MTGGREQRRLELVAERRVVADVLREPLQGFPIAVRGVRPVEPVVVVPVVQDLLPARRLARGGLGRNGRRYDREGEHCEGDGDPRRHHLGILRYRFKRSVKPPLGLC
jgi:hypothetical protein